MFTETSSATNIERSLNEMIDFHSKAEKWKKPIDTNNISDGYHTFGELYEFRKQYNAALFNSWALASQYNVHKSLRHNDGELCFGGGWFIVVAVLPTGQISNHYKVEDWDLFNIPASSTALVEFDGHTPADVIKRLNDLNLKTDEITSLAGIENEPLIEMCSRCKENPASEETHCCPYNYELNDDKSEACKCCDDCTFDCRSNI